MSLRTLSNAILGHAFLASKLRPGLLIILGNNVIKTKLNLMYLQNSNKRAETMDSKSLPPSILLHLKKIPPPISLGFENSTSPTQNTVPPPQPLIANSPLAALAPKKKKNHLKPYISGSIFPTPPRQRSNSQLPRHRK